MNTNSKTRISDFSCRLVTIEQIFEASFQVSDSVMLLADSVQRKIDDQFRFRGGLEDILNFQRYNLVQKNRWRVCLLYSASSTFLPDGIFQLSPDAKKVLRRKE